MPSFAPVGKHPKPPTRGKKPKATLPIGGPVIKSKGAGAPAAGVIKKFAAGGTVAFAPRELRRVSETLREAPGGLREAPGGLKRWSRQGDTDQTWQDKRKTSSMGMRTTTKAPKPKPSAYEYMKAASDKILAAGGTPDYKSMKEAKDKYLSGKFNKGGTVKKKK
jgi:hypothetical protein